MIHIVIHILPQEIDQLESLLIQLKRNSVYLPKDHGIVVEVCMNMNLVEWQESHIGGSFFVDKLMSLHKLTLSWSPNSHHVIDYDGIINGCNDLRRKIIRTTELSYIMYLDADCIFSDTFLINMYNAVKNTHDQIPGYHIIVPQTTRMWDSTWDCITNNIYLDEEASHEVYNNRDPYEVMYTANGYGCIVRSIDTFKFAGWGTTIPTALARQIDIPDSLGSYGLDDTFIMETCKIMKRKCYPVQQWVLQNEVIIENNKFRTNPYKDYLVTIDRREEFLAQAHANFNKELNLFNERLDNYLR